MISTIGFTIDKAANHKQCFIVSAKSATLDGLINLVINFNWW